MENETPPECRNKRVFVRIAFIFLKIEIQTQLKWSGSRHHIKSNTIPTYKSEGLQNFDKTYNYL